MCLHNLVVVLHYICIFVLSVFLKNATSLYIIERLTTAAWTIIVFERVLRLPTSERSPDTMSTKISNSSRWICIYIMAMHFNTKFDRENKCILYIHTYTYPTWLDSSFR